MTNIELPVVYRDEIHIFISSKPSNQSTIDCSSIDPSASVIALDDNVKMTFYCGTKFSAMERPANEMIAKCLKRFQATVNKSEKPKQSKKAKKTKGNTESTIDSTELDQPIVIYQEQILDTETMSNSQWIDGSIIKYLNLTYLVRVNPPVVIDIDTYPRGQVMIGFPIRAITKVNYAIEEQSIISWYRRKDAFNEYEYICDGTIYTPTETDRGYQLKLFCTPRYNEIYGRSAVQYISGTVQTQVLPGITRARSDFLQNIHIQQHTENQLRVVTYNVLSDNYATTKMYHYCKEQELTLDYRCQIILHELVSYKADIICLQECDLKVYELYYLPILATHGYTGRYSGKDVSVNEGCAMFLLKSKFTIECFYDIPLRHLMSNDYKLQPFFTTHPEVYHRITDSRMGHIVQIGIFSYTLQGVKHVIVVSNTHIFYHPEADFIRLLQMSCIVSLNRCLYYMIERHPRHWKDLMNQQTFIDYAQSDSIDCLNEQLEKLVIQADECDSSYVLVEEEVKIGIIIAGDFNSSPDSPCIEYLEQSTLSNEHDIWKTIYNFNWKSQAERYGESAVTTSSPIKSNSPMKKVITANSGGQNYPHLRHDFNFLSAAGHTPYSNFTEDFKSLLDYIFIDQNHFKVAAIGGFPTIEEFEEELFLPSSKFPSDHVSVVVDIEWII